MSASFRLLLENLLPLLLLLLLLLQTAVSAAAAAAATKSFVKLIGSPVCSSCRVLSMRLCMLDEQK